METNITVESLPLLGVCKLCLREGIVKSMLVAHNHNGSSEIYADMLYKCFSIDLPLQSTMDTKWMVCESCVNQLRDCVAFKQQVEHALKTLQASLTAQESENKSDLKEEVDLATEGDDFNDNIPHDDDYDEDDEKVLKAFLIKEEPKESPKKKSKDKIKMKSRKLIKSKVKKEEFQELEALLEVGLFPFKMRKNSSFSCSICPEKSTNLDDIKNHITDHSKSNIQIAFRKMIFSKSQRFYKRYGKLRCKICTADISNYEELKQHIENCTRLKYSSRQWNNLPFKLEKDQLDCPVCKKTFLNYVSLNNHMNVHYPNYICENCGKAFASKARLRGHMRTHEVGSFPCRYCNAVFDRVTKRENHVSKEHKSGVRYACKRCNIQLTSFYARQKHLAEVHNEELKRYKCKACPQSYITPGHLSSHVRRDHLNERNHKCDKCDLAFYTKNALKMHMIKHDGERIHTCPVCQKSYQRKKTLREHLRIHNNDKRFICPVCGRAFTQKCTLKGHLKVHERKVDIDERIGQPLSSILGV